jgi:acetylornithine deacetylase/succinyl-diaminopimelate desuccinylase-like protein
MRVATGHKGKIAARATCCGVTGHSALAPRALNAIHLACDFIASIREQQSRIEREGPRDDDYEVPYTTLHVGYIDGATALNIVPNRCTVDFEIRSIARDDTGGLLDRLMNEAAAIAARRRDAFPQAHIGIEVFNTRAWRRRRTQRWCVSSAGSSHPKTSRRLISEPRGASSGSASGCQLSYADRDQWIRATSRMSSLRSTNWKRATA